MHRRGTREPVQKGKGQVTSLLGSGIVGLFIRQRLGRRALSWHVEVGVVLTPALSCSMPSDGMHVSLAC